MDYDRTDNAFPEEERIYLPIDTLPLEFNTIEGCEYWYNIYTSLLKNREFQKLFRQTCPDFNFEKDCIPSLENHFRPAHIDILIRHIYDNKISPRQNQLYKDIVGLYNAIVAKVNEQYQDKVVKDENIPTMNM